MSAHPLMRRREAHCGDQETVSGREPGAPAQAHGLPPGPAWHTCGPCLPHGAQGGTSFSPTPAIPPCPARLRKLRSKVSSPLTQDVDDPQGQGTPTWPLTCPQGQPGLGPIHPLRVTPGTLWATWFNSRGQQHNARPREGGQRIPNKRMGRNRSQTRLPPGRCRDS